MSGAVSKTYVDADFTGGLSAPFPINWRGGPVALELTVNSGTPNLDIESTNVDLNSGEVAASTDWVVDNTASAGITASKWITFNAMPRFIRLKLNSGSTISVTIRTTQSDV